MKVPTELISKLVQPKFKKAPMPKFKTGDNVKVHVKIVEGEKERVQIFEGTVIKLRQGGLNSSFTVRKISDGVGVERIFPFYSTAIDQVELVSKGIARRNRLYYLRRLIGKAARLDSTLVSASEATAKPEAPKA